MKKLLAHTRGESGQVFVFIAVLMTALLGMAALVIDVGSWYQAQRNLQTAADAAALAGAQELPLSPSLAKDVAGQYAELNYQAPLITFPAPTTDCPETYCIHVVAEADTPGFFVPAFERILNSEKVHDVVTVHAEAQAKVSAPLELKNVAPIAVHTSMACIVTDPGCFGPSQPKTLTFDPDAEFDPTKSKFGLLDLDRDGSAGAGDMKDWLEDGYPGYLPINTDYPPANGEKNGIKKELEDAADEGRILLFPVFDTANESTGYHIIGWAAFVIDDIVKWTGHEHELTGYFVTFIATDLAAGNPITDPDLNFGVKVISLTK